VNVAFSTETYGDSCGLFPIGQTSVKIFAPNLAVQLPEYCNASLGH
jgi:hypothetical protein